MTNNKTQKENVLEIIRKNKSIVEKNLEVAKVHLEALGLTKSSKRKSKKSRKGNGISFDEFLKVAYAQLREDANELAKSKSLAKENSKKEKEEVKKKKETKSQTNNSKKKTEVSKSVKQSPISKDFNEKSKTKLSSSELEVKKVVLTENETKTSKESTLHTLADKTDKKDNSKISKTNSLNYPPSTDGSKNVELSNPFKELKRNDGNIQLGFSVPIEENIVVNKKTRKKSVKDKNAIIDNQTPELQMSFLV